MRKPWVEKDGLKKGAWSEEEDNKLRAYVLRYGHWNWRLLPKFAGLARCGKSCRLRWLNYLKPGVKRGNYTKEEKDLIAKLHHQLGNKWSAIAAKLPGRTDNEIKNYCHTHLKKRGPLPKPESSSQTSARKNYEEESLASGNGKLENIYLGNDRMHILESSPGSVSEDNSAFSVPSTSSSANNSLDAFAGFEDSFWTEPFVVESCSYVQEDSFLPLDDLFMLEDLMSTDS